MRCRVGLRFPRMADGDKHAPGDEEILADPGRFTVDQVTSAFERSGADAVAASKSRESAIEKPRKGVLEWEPPAYEAPEPVDEYTPAGWRERCRRLLGVSPHALAGALHDVAADEVLDANQVRKRLGGFDRETGVEEPDGDSEA